MGFVENIVNASHSIELVKKLIGNASSIDETDKDGNTALLWACREGKVRIAQLLIDAKANLDIANKVEDTPLTIASSDGQTLIVEYLVLAKADINKPNKSGWTPLICAAYNGESKVVEFLLTHKADINRTSNVGCTALYWACNNGKLDTVKVLLDHGADIDKPNNVGITPLMQSARWGRTNVISILLERGADFELVDNDGRNAASIALEFKHQDVVDQLISHKTHIAASKSPNISSNAQSTSEEKSAMEMQKALDWNMKQLEINQPLVTSSLASTPSAPSSNSNNNNSGGDSSNTTLNLRLRSLAEASPQVIEYLKKFGNAAYEADQQYQTITRDPSLMEYYVTFNKNVSGAVVASLSISSGMIADSRVSSVEQIVNVLNSAANATSVFAVPLVTSLFAYVVKIPNDIDRVQTVKRITTCFPSIDSHKFIEMLAREVTILLASDIRAVMKLAKKHSKKSILSMAAKAVEWLATYDNTTPIQAYANMHSALLIDKLMRHDPLFTVQHTDIPMLIEWATGIDVKTNKSPLMRSGSSLFKTVVSSPSSQESTSTALGTAAAVLPPVQEGEELQERSAPVEYAEKDLVDERINKLMLKLEQEEAARLKLEAQLKDVKELSNKVQRLNALNEIFGNLEEGRLTQSQNKQSIAAAIENHFKNQAIAQNLTDETLRELVLQVQLIMENQGTSSGGGFTPRSSSPVPGCSPNTSSAPAAAMTDSQVNPRIDDGDVLPPPKSAGVEKVGGGGCGCVVM